MKRTILLIILAFTTIAGFTQQTHNSFLHNSFLRLIQVLKAKKQLSPQLLKKLNLFSKILQCFKNRENDFHSNYWGQMRIIAELINPYASKCQVQQPEWNQLMTEICISEKIISSDYGGWVKQKKGVSYCDKTLLIICIIGLIIAICIGIIPQARKF